MNSESHCQYQFVSCWGPMLQRNVSLAAFQETRREARPFCQKNTEGLRAFTALTKSTIYLLRLEIPNLEGLEGRLVFLLDLHQCCNLRHKSRAFQCRGLLAASSFVLSGAFRARFTCTSDFYVLTEWPWLASNTNRIERPAERHALSASGLVAERSLAERSGYALDVTPLEDL